MSPLSFRRRGGRTSSGSSARRPPAAAGPRRHRLVLPGIGLSEIGRHAQLRRRLRKGVAADGEYLARLFNLGAAHLSLYFETGDRPTAAARSRLRADDRPRSQERRGPHPLGRCYLESGQFDRAIASLETARSLKPDLVMSNTSSAWPSCRRGISPRPTPISSPSRPDLRHPHGRREDEPGSPDPGMRGPDPLDGQLIQPGADGLGDGRIGFGFQAEDGHRVEPGRTFL